MAAAETGKETLDQTDRSFSAVSAVTRLDVRNATHAIRAKNFFCSLTALIETFV
jgi:hypothetical protein